MSIESGRAERAEAEALLDAAGYRLSGGGMMVLGPDAGGWDVFIEDPDKPGDEYGFTSLAEVREYIAARARS